MNIPNFLSVLRIMIIPLFIILLSYHQYKAACAVFLLAAVTDALDGFLARVFNQKTTLGSYLDPIADKLLLASSFVACALLGLIPRWLAILVVSRDIIISMGIILLRLNALHVEIRPRAISKCTTFFQLLSIACALLLSILHKDYPAAAAVFWATGVLTVASGIHYILIGLKIINLKNT